MLTKKHHGISDGSEGALKYMSMSPLIFIFYNAYQKHHGISDGYKAALNMCDPALIVWVYLVGYINMFKSSISLGIETTANQNRLTQ